MNTSTNAIVKGLIVPLLLLMVTCFTACGAVTPDTPKPTASKTPTHAATFTPRPTPLPTATSLPTATLSPIESYVQKMQSLPERCPEASVLDGDNGRSPDGNWTVYNCNEEFELLLSKRDGSKAWLLIINRDGSKAWHFGHDQFFPGATDVPDMVSVRHWSDNSQYVYFLPRFSQPCCWDPAGGTSIDMPLFNWLWQFNINTGEYFNIFENIASVHNDEYPSASAISFSPDGKTLLVISQRWVVPPIVYVYDLEQNKAFHSFDLAGSENSITAGNVVWSPDGQRIAMTSGSGGDFEWYIEGNPYKEWLYSVIVIDVTTWSQKVIIAERKGDLIYLRAITNENILLLESSKPATADGSGALTYEQYDLTTNQFLTPTP